MELPVLSRSERYRSNDQFLERDQGEGGVEAGN